MDQQRRIDLAGTWTRAVGGVRVDTVAVPGSYPPVGECVLEREVAVPWDAAGDERVFLVTEGVLAEAEFSVDGTAIGAAGPWSTYRLELPRGLLSRGPHRIAARVRDMPAEFGPMPGRRFDGGLARPIRLERRPRAFLADVHFRAEVAADSRSAQATVAVTIDGPADSARVRVALTERGSGRMIASGEASPGAPFTFRVDAPRLWSPDRPDLYTLTATLPGDEPYVEQVGFRRIERRGRDLWLNGERLLLKGVCRHEFTHASGYAPAEAEVRRELARIRHAGFNFIRLVHSPQSGVVCRLAAELGLLVSEEPGTCWHDLADERIAAPAVECLRRTILRDRNVPSVLAWFIYNECNPVVAYAVRIARMCRELDPGCLVGMADCSGDDATLRKMAAEADLSLYGINVYAGRKAFIERLRVLDDRPVVITEWSGFLGQGNARQMADYCDLFVRHAQPDEPQRLSGGSIWVWADYAEHSRPSPASVDGWTVEGLVRPDGTAKPDLAILSQMCFDMDHPPQRLAPAVEALCTAPQRVETWQPVPLAAIGGDQAALEARMAALRRFRDIDNWQSVPSDHEGYPISPPLPRWGRRIVDGIAFACRDTDAALPPLLLGRERDAVVIPIGRRIAGIAVLGHVCLWGGLPAPAPAVWKGERCPAVGELAAEYELVFADRTEVVPLRHGIELLRHNDICRWWNPSPLAAATRPALRCVTDARYESFRLDLWQRPLAPGDLREIRWRLRDPEALILMAALSVEIA